MALTTTAARRRQTMCLAAAIAVALVAQARPAQAQTTYKCTGGGTVHYSDRPCDGERGTAPAAHAGAQQTPGRDVDRQPGFMNLHCRQMAQTVQRLQQQAAGASEEAVVHERLAIEQERYNQACYEDEQRARERTAEAARAEQDRRRAEQQRVSNTLAQCDEMRRIRAAKSAQRAAMTALERADLARFEANFVARCQGIAPR